MQDKREIPEIVNEKLSDLAHDFLNFNALNLLKRFIKKLDRSRFDTQGILLVA